MLKGQYWNLNQLEAVFSKMVFVNRISHGKIEVYSLRFFLNFKLSFLGRSKINFTLPYFLIWQRNLHQTVLNSAQQCQTVSQQCQTVSQQCQTMSNSVSTVYSTVKSNLFL
ncbi:unnamed protein product [Cuscuta epithymum]|uniref:Uncharacterized protein n=1 Tax=Cuscuta epithymum TaxID=186058 RepID=A0AAV0CRT6_9ASTE|nr:unnamed protein product [Cuscuta epithymum]